MKKLLLFLFTVSTLGFAVANIESDSIKLGQNHPNPAVDKTFIEVSFDTEVATLSVYNILGHLVEQKELTPLNNRVTLDVSDYPEGLYLYTLEAGGERITRRMTVKKR